MERYQGIVALDGESLADAALTYFRQSEQLPTFLRLAVARHYMAGEKRRAGHVAMARRRADDPESAARRRQSAGAAPEGSDDARAASEDATTTGSARASLPRPSRTTSCSIRRCRRSGLLYRLFHEEGVRALPPAPVEAYCRCSRERVEAFLRSFGAEGLADMREPDGGISVTCEFCATKYRFEPGEIA